MPQFYALELANVNASGPQRVLLDGHDCLNGILSRIHPKIARRHGAAIGRAASRLGLYGARAEEVAKIFGPLPPDRCHEIAQKINAQTWMTRAATRLMQRVGYDRFSRNIASQCDDELMRLHKEQQPTILLFTHSGPFDAIAATLHRLGLPVLVVTWMWRYRQPSPLEIYDIGLPGGTRDGSFKRVVGKLRENGMVIMSVDTPITRVLDVQLFGRTFSYAPGPFAAARLAGAALTPITASWNADRKIEIALSEPLNAAEPPKPLSSYSKEDAAAIDQSLANRAAVWFENFFRAQPEQISIGLLRSLCTR